MVGDNPSGDRLVRNLRHNGGAVPSPGPASGAGPARYTVDGPTKAVYDAQFKLLAVLDAEHLSPRNFWPDEFFSSVDEMQAWVDRVTARDWSNLRAGPPLRLTVQLQTPRTFAFDSGRILAPRDRPLAWRSLFLVHELAHAYGNPTAHDLTFVRTMTTMVEVCISHGAADRFRELLTAENVQT